VINILGWRGYYLGEKHRNNPRDNYTFRLRDADNLEIGAIPYMFFLEGGGALWFIFNQKQCNENLATNKE
jgi:hypothetical protein